MTREAARCTWLPPSHRWRGPSLEKEGSTREESKLVSSAAPVHKKRRSASPSCVQQKKEAAHSYKLHPYEGVYCIVYSSKIRKKRLERIYTKAHVRMKEKSIRSEHALKIIYEPSSGNIVYADGKERGEVFAATVFICVYHGESLPLVYLGALALY